MRVQGLALVVLMGLTLLSGCGGKGTGSTAVADTDDLRSADEQWARGDLHRARSVLQSILERDSKSFPARYRLGVMEVDGAPREAMQDLEQAAALEPDHPGPRLFLGLVRLSLSDFAGAKREMEEAEALARKRQGVALADTTEVLRHGLDALLAQEPDAALADFRTALDRDSTRAEVWFYTGLAARRAGKLWEAEHAARRALELRPTFPQAHALLGGIYVAQGKEPEARRELQAALAERPDLATAYYQIAVLDQKESEYRDAALAYWHSLLEDPTVPDAFYNLGRLLTRMQMPAMSSVFLQHYEWVKTYLDRKYRRGPMRR